jgi:ATP-binding cassette, subfamily B, bacterial HlyB/CyaB
MSDRIASGALLTALQCFVAVARRRGIDLSAERLIHDYALSETELTSSRLLQIARDTGFKAKTANLRWRDLSRLGDAYPFLARLDNGNTVVVAGIRHGTPDEVAVLDPLADRPGFIFLDETGFCRNWSGGVVFLKRVHRLTDEAQPFGLRWFVPEFLRQVRIFRDVTVAALTLQVLALATPIFIQIVLDKVLVHQAYTTLYVLTAGVCAAILFDAGFNFLERYLLLFASNKIDIRTATRTFAHLLSLPIDFFERASAGVLVKHMQQAERIREFLTGRLFLTLLDAMALFVVVPVLFLYSARLTVIVLGFAGLIALIIALLVGPFRRRLRELYEAEGQRQAALVETIHGMETVKALAIEPRRRRDWDTRCAQAVMSHFRVGRISASAQAVTGLFEKLMIVAVIGIGATSVFEGRLTLGALIAFQMLASRVTGPLAKIVSLVHEYQEAALSVRMLGQVMNRPPERAVTSRGLRPAFAGCIELEGVTFRYAESGPPALENVSVTIPAGSVFGIVGRTGSGKTTLTRLIRGMYPVQWGAVRIDGYDIRELDLVHWRTNCGVVLQENFLFRGTVSENIGATKPDATFEEIVAAAEVAGANEFIRTLPQGYDTMLEENGANLSGGQKQRIAIARALLRQPRVLILDEAMSALDPETEAIVQKNLATIARGRTVVLVSHRLSALTNADAILVLDRGRMVDLGRHAELVGRCTTYRQLWNQQHQHLRQAAQ